MARTRRQEIAGILRQGPHAVNEIARRLGASVKSILSDLEHVRRGTQDPQRWVATAPECVSCGFVFRGRERLDAPSRCPRCRGEDILEARYSIEDRG